MTVIAFPGAPVAEPDPEPDSRRNGAPVRPFRYAVGQRVVVRRAVVHSLTGITGKTVPFVETTLHRATLVGRCRDEQGRNVYLFVPCDTERARAFPSACQERDIVTLVLPPPTPALMLFGEGVRLAA